MLFFVFAHATANNYQNSHSFFIFIRIIHLKCSSTDKNIVFRVCDGIIHSHIDIFGICMYIDINTRKYIYIYICICFLFRLQTLLVYWVINKFTLTIIVSGLLGV